MGIFNRLFGKKEKTPETEKTKQNESNLGDQYYKLEEILFHEKSSYHEEFRFLKKLLKSLKLGEISNDDHLTSYIKNHHKKYEGSNIMYKRDLYQQLEEVFTLYLEDWETKKETNFLGFKDVEQYHSLSQKIITELGNLLKEKIMELGK